MADPYVLETITPKSWGCTNPNLPPYHYQQNTDPFSLYQQSDTMFPNVPLGICPSCFLAKKGSFAMAEVPVANIVISHDIASDAAIDQIAQAENLDATQTQDLINQRNDTQTQLQQTAV